MGPIASPVVAALPSRRWLALVVVPIALALARPTTRPPPNRVDPPDRVDALDALELRLDAIAATHRRWVAEHGAGCARGLDHLTPYAADLDAPDPWGSALVFSCSRADADRAIRVSVTSLGPDRLPGGGDDLVGTDSQPLP